MSSPSSGRGRGRININEVCATCGLGEPCREPREVPCLPEGTQRKSHRAGIWNEDPPSIPWERAGMRNPGWSQRDLGGTRSLSQSLSLLTCKLDAVTVTTSQSGSEDSVRPGGRQERTESLPVSWALKVTAAADYLAGPVCTLVPELEWLAAGLCAVSLCQRGCLPRNMPPWPKTDSRAFPGR